MQKIFDSHLHLWDLEQIPISWLKDKFLQRNFHFAEYKKEWCGFEFLGAMYVEVNSDDVVKEANFALNLKKLYGLKLCLADLKHKEKCCAFREVLHTSLKGAKRVYEEDFKALLKELENSHLVFEACMKSEELHFLEVILKEYPKLQIVLNHFGSPQISNLQNYKNMLSLLSKYENLWIKLSAPDDFSSKIPKESLFSLFAFLKRHFTEEKLVFGSNYPVAQLSPSEWANLIIQSKVFTNLNALFYENAFKLYKGG